MAIRRNTPETITYFGLHSLAYTVRGHNYSRLSPAAKHVIDFHESLHRDGNGDEADVSWKQKDLTEQILLQGSYDNGKALQEWDYQHLRDTWYTIDGAYHASVGSLRGNTLWDRLKLKGASDRQVETIRGKTFGIED